MNDAKATDFLAFDDELAEVFFSEPPPPAPADDPWQGSAMGQRDRWAMMLSVSAVGVALLVCLGLVMWPRRSIDVGHAQIAGWSLPTAPLRQVPQPGATAPPVHPAAAPDEQVTEPPAGAPAPDAHAVVRRGARQLPRAELLTRRAFRAHNAGQHGRAAALAQQAIQLDPSRAGAYIVLGGVRDTRGDQAGAQRAFHDCVQHAKGPLVSGCRTLTR